jgi:histidinol-phosphate phosphatase family protein
MSSRAAFLDRDGTIIEDVHYIARPELVRLLPKAAAGIRAFNDSGIAVVVVTNQSGIARGLFTEADYTRVQQRMTELLTLDGARVDASYMCPHHPELGQDCNCRKPGTLLFRQAAHDHDLDLAQSTFIGDRWRDVSPALALGGQGILVESDATPASERDQAEQAGIPVVGDLLAAARLARREV